MHHKGPRQGVTFRWYLHRADSCVRVLGAWHNPEQHRRSNGQQQQSTVIVNTCNLLQPGKCKNSVTKQNTLCFLTNNRNALTKLYRDIPNTLIKHVQNYNRLENSGELNYVTEKKGVSLKTSRFAKSLIIKTKNSLRQAHHIYCMGGYMFRYVQDHKKAFLWIKSVMLRTCWDPNCVYNWYSLIYLKWAV
jgi:hypothetical protein